MVRQSRGATDRNDRRSDRDFHRLSRRSVLRASALGVGMSGLASSAAAQADESFVNVLSVDPSAYPNILLNVRVDTELGRNGELGREAFTISERGKSIPIQSFDFSGAASDVAFVFDDTGSMREEISAMKAGVTNLTDSLEEAGIDARYALVSVKDDVEVDQRFTSDAAALKSHVSDLVASGGGDTPEDNFDAIETALGLDYRDGARKFIIDITDAPSHYAGDGSGVSETTLDEVATDLTESGVSFVAVSPATRNERSSKRTLAERVGGLWIDIQSADFGRILEEIIGVLVTVYQIIYITALPPEGAGEVTVTVEDPNAGTGRDTNDVSIPEIEGTRTLEITKEGVPEGKAHYDLEVSGELEAGDEFDETDTIDGASAEGSIGPARGTDNLRFSGGVVEFTLTGPARVSLDGKEVDPDSLGRSDLHTLEVTKEGASAGEASYSVTVSGELERRHDINEEDAIDGNTARGQIDGDDGSDSVEFTGEITDFRLDGDATVLIDNEEVDPDSLGGNDEPSNTIRITKEGAPEGKAHYDIDVDGELRPGAKFDETDTIDGASAEGSIGPARGTDNLRFSGNIVEFTLTGPARVYLNDEQVDPADIGRSDLHTLEVTKEGASPGEASYSLTVSGELERRHDVNEEDAIDGNTARGRIDGDDGSDSVEFTGEITDFRLDGDATVLIDNEEVDAANLPIVIDDFEDGETSVEPPNWTGWHTGNNADITATRSDALNGSHSGRASADGDRFGRVYVKRDSPFSPVEFRTLFHMKEVNGDPASGQSSIQLIYDSNESSSSSVEPIKISFNDSGDIVNPATVRPLTSYSEDTTYELSFTNIDFSEQTFDLKIINVDDDTTVFDQSDVEMSLPGGSDVTEINKLAYEIDGGYEPPLEIVFDDPRFKTDTDS